MEERQEDGEEKLVTMFANPLVRRYFMGGGVRGVSARKVGRGKRGNCEKIDAAMLGIFLYTRSTPLQWAGSNGHQVYVGRRGETVQSGLNENKVTLHWGSSKRMGKPHLFLIRSVRKTRVGKRRNTGQIP